MNRKLTFVVYNFEKYKRSSDFLREIFGKEHKVHDYFKY
tara:strand:+ start:188 stop:304 length:117 start_codon:yes stop_codon:yes gene_type:complete